jgi:hypothetical protein
VAQDTKFWYDLVNVGAKFYTIPEALVHFRIHEKTGISAQHKEEQTTFLKTMITEHIATKIPVLSIEEIGIFIDFCMQKYVGKASHIRQVLNKIVQYNHQKYIFEQAKFDSIIDKLFVEYMHQQNKLSIFLWLNYYKLRTKTKHITGLGHKIRFFIACLYGKT